MNLYQVNVTHYAPRDSNTAIWGYVLSESNESLYNWLKSEPQLPDDNINNIYISIPYDDDDDNDDNEMRSIEFDKQMLLHQDEQKTYYANYDDLYYGRTFVSWNEIKSNVDMENIKIIKDMGIRIFNTEVIYER